MPAYDPTAISCRSTSRLSYGLVEYLRIVQMMEAAGWSRRRCVPHAGHLFSLSVVAGLGLGAP